MKHLAIACAIGFLATPVWAQGVPQQAPPTAEEIAAFGDLQLGQTLARLGQSEQQVIALRKQVTDLTQQLAAARAPKPDETKP